MFLFSNRIHPDIHLVLLVLVPSLQGLYWCWIIRTVTEAICRIRSGSPLVSWWHIATVVLADDSYESHDNGELVVFHRWSFS